jgi:hypothetical protein
MKAYALLQEVARNPDAQLVVFAAFDAAWSAIADRYPADGPEREQARLRLASAMLPFVTESAIDPLWLRDAALRAFNTPPET